MSEPTGGVGQGFFDSLGIVGCTDGVEIGVGGFGVVYRAYQPAYDRMVAVKLLNTIADEQSRRRFDRECRALGGLSGHPNIVVLHDAGTTSTGRPYLVMEYLAHGTFADRVDRAGPMPWPEAVTAIVKVAGAVETAHRRNVLHRDIKPENILLSEYGEPKLADFGIAYLGDAAASKSQHITASIAHAPPEVLDGKHATAASDVYSLASSLFFLMTGTGAFVREDDESIWPLIMRTLNDPVPDLSTRGFPDDLAASIQVAMAKDPSDRYATAEAFADALAKVAERAGYGPIGLVIAKTHPRDGAVEIVTLAPEADQIPPPPSNDPTRTVPREAPPAQLPPAPDPAAPGPVSPPADAIAPPAVPPAPPPRLMPPPGNRLGRRRGLLVAAALLVVAGTVGGVLARRGDGNEDGPKADDEEQATDAGTTETTEPAPPLEDRLLQLDDLPASFTQIGQTIPSTEDTPCGPRNIDLQVHAEDGATGLWMIAESADQLLEKVRRYRDAAQAGEVFVLTRKSLTCSQGTVYPSTGPEIGVFGTNVVVTISGAEQGFITNLTFGGVGYSVITFGVVQVGDLVVTVQSIAIQTAEVTTNDERERVYLLLRRSVDLLRG